MVAVDLNHPGADLINLLIDLAIGLLFVLASIGLSLIAYMATRRIAGQGPHDRHKEMASAMVTRIAALHGLILALVFAQEMAAYQRLDTQTAAEASAVADVYNDAARYDLQASAPLQETMVGYLDAVVGTEWAALGRGDGLDAGAWQHWETAYNFVLDLVPETDRQTSLRDHMLESLHVISSSRDARENDADHSVAHFFWIAALSGVVLIAAGHYIYAPERHNVVLLSLFSAYSGAILFLIFGFTNPYAPPAALSPAPLVKLQAEIAEGPVN